MAVVYTFQIGISNTIDEEKANRIAVVYTFQIGISNTGHMPVG